MEMKTKHKNGECFSGWSDISVPLKSGMVHWPGDSDVRIERVADKNKGAKANLSRLDMSAHSNCKRRWGSGPGNSPTVK